MCCVIHYRSIHEIGFPCCLLLEPPVTDQIRSKSNLELDVRSTMGHSRQFLNLIVESKIRAATRSLRRIDPNRLQLFYPTPPPPPRAPIRQPTTTTTERIRLPGGSPISNLERIRLPGPILNLGAHNLRGAGDPCDLACYPFGQRKVLTTDQAGRNFIYDLDTRDVAAMPEFHKPKLRRDLHFSLFVPSGGGDDGGGSLYLMARDLWKVERFKISVGQPSNDFEVLFYDNGRTTSHCKQLPLPAFVLEPIRPSNERLEIRAYAVVGGGSHICVSIDGRGTYAMDTASHAWSKVGDWTLPFHGKVEYVPELKLWFGLSGDGDTRHLAAADLSAMDAHSPPQLAAGGRDREEFQRPVEWAEQGLDIDQRDVQVVSLGSGRFCIARFFVDWRESEDDRVFYFAVLTGVEVLPRVLPNGEVKLEMNPHKSVCHHMSVDGACIEQLF